MSDPSFVPFVLSPESTGLDQLRPQKNAVPYYEMNGCLILVHDLELRRKNRGILTAYLEFATLI
jgi:hypothetical protein